MSSLREIRNHISSVRSTLKITSAMKLVASSKLRKAQRSIESLRPYELALTDTLSSLVASCSSSPVTTVPDEEATNTALVVIASNSSLCGGFNANIIRKAEETIKSVEGKVKVFAIGRKVADAMKRDGFLSEADYSDIIGHPSFDRSTALSDELVRRFKEGEFSRVLLIYSHFVSASTQTQVVEQYLPFVPKIEEGLPSHDIAEDNILEPSREALLESLLPQVITLKFHAAVLDSSAAEHAARTVAMQTATDNAQELLSDLTLEYNKGRQQKITSEILDLVGGSMQ
ncbi:MAG: ATP synthase F1 subunit gamma [Bacteroidales bacterium]|nr:ATP synthase F1 subunit gamma [Bacteroidales bacterium]